MSGALLAAALELAELGLAIVPIYGVEGGGRCACGRRDCSSPAKHPRTKHGHKDASRDTAQIAVWWNACPRKRGRIRAQGRTVREVAASLATVTKRKGRRGRHQRIRP